MLHIRVDRDTRERATSALNAMGLTMSEAVRPFLTRVVAEQALPLELKVPNAETRAAMAKADEILEARRARFETAKDLMASLEKAGGE